ncbi:hypothetical protein [Bacterioplanoides sp.]|uniref:hypothetical protein n=1 Tax=Bacterioplanoides sp. TaxID=2066072 RepID=UPI003B5CC436
MKYTILIIIFLCNSAFAVSIYSDGFISNSYGQYLSAKNLKGCFEYERSLSLLCTEALEKINRNLARMNGRILVGEEIGRIPLQRYEISENVDFRRGYFSFKSDQNNTEIFPDGLKFSGVSQVYAREIKISSNSIGGDGTIRNHNVDLVGLGKDIDYDVDLSAESGWAKLGIFISFFPRLFEQPDGSKVLVLEPTVRVLTGEYALEEIDFDVDFYLPNFLFTLVNFIAKSWLMTEFKWPENLKNVATLSKFLTYLKGFIESVCLPGADPKCNTEEFGIDTAFIKDIFWDQFIEPVAVSASVFALDHAESMFGTMFHYLAQGVINHDHDTVTNRPFFNLEQKLDVELRTLMGANSDGLVFIEIDQLEDKWEEVRTASLVSTGIF